ncbi:hypothetical protein FH608_045340 [Nonomuraea phyllanthi]|uniref:Uncharacterized protein n=1 Tax=Nonomuraea phyllanthi TaxID=2219224 RepID=A0A5C4VA85_9ACTN|nr:hypothetical protein [Nonomuraea phyllanthi]KAB8187506.1 hypothetical protein FH608_045340 [Nonomuraea phyllanthi]QFY07064.1 hypothetical protein GBF35_10540 [Nonomuraea phyllanthi]
MRPRHLSRRVVLAGGAAALTAGGTTLTACSATGPPEPSAKASDSPETTLLKGLIAEKERTIALYSSLITGGARKLVPFRERHEAHLKELRKYVVVSSAPPATASPSAATVSAAPSATPEPSLSELRDLERKAAAQRAKQLAGLSPGVAQLIASIGACEAAHVVALPRSL